MGAATMRERFGEVVTDLLDSDPSVAVVLAVIGASRLAETGAIDRHPDRVIDVGIREQLMIGVAGGLALAGFRPFVHSYAPFLVERPFEQIKLDLSHQGAGAVLVSVGGSYEAASEGRTHQAPADVALIGTLPGWEIYVPGHADEAETVLRHAARRTGGVYVRLSEQSNPEPVPVVPGRFHCVRQGAAATILAVGPMLAPVLEATEGLDVTVLYAVTARPFDHAGLRARAAGPVVVVEPYAEGTSAHEVAVALGGIPHRLVSIGVPRAELRRYGRPEDHAAAHGLDPDGLRRRIGSLLGDPPVLPSHERRLVAL
jgi:transketolase